MKEHTEYFETNRQGWNARTELHKDSEFYDLKSFKEGKSSLFKIVDGLLSDIQGKSLLHLQCHFGMDTLSFARKGAIVTGIDISDNSIETANALSEELNIPARFIRSNVYDIEDVLGDKQYDNVFTSYGSIVWLPDLSEWARLIHKYLKPGGSFTIVDFHPALDMFNWEKEKLEYNYFNTGVYEETLENTYAAKDKKITLKEYFWIHSLSEIMSALIEQGLQVSHFKEYDYSPFNCFENMQERAENEYIWGTHGIAFPHVFSLQCTKA